MGRGACFGLLAWALLCGCSESGTAARPDAAVSADVPVIAADAPPDVAPLPDTCPPGWVRLPDRNCAPPALACDPDAGTTDPTCLPGGLRSAALTPWACPAGWRQDAERGCVPTLRTDCPEGSGPLPDGTCTDTVTCPEGPYPEIPAGADTSRVVYVDDDAPEGGDGSRARPLRDLNAAIERADPSGAVLVAAGEYRVRVDVRGRRTVAGLCAERVLLRPQDDSHAGKFFDVRGADASLRLSGVAFRSNLARPLVLTEGAHASLRSIRTRVQDTFVVDALFGRVDVADVYSLCVGEAADGSPAQSMVHATNSVVSIRRSYVRGQRTRLVGGYDPLTEVGVENSVAEDVFDGVLLRNIMRVNVERFVVRRALFTGVLFSGDATARDLSIEGASVGASHGARLTAERLSITNGALGIAEQGTTVALTDLAVRWTGDVPRDGGDCVSVRWGARATIRRARLGPCWGAGVYAYLLGESELEDAYIRDPRPNAIGETGVGATAALGGRVSLRRTVIERAALAGVASIHLSQTVLRRLPLPMLLPVYGAQLQQQPSRVALSDVVIRDSRNVPGQPSFAVAAGANSVTTGERVAVLGQDGAGLLAMESGFDRAAFVDGIARETRLDMSARGLLTALLPPTIDGPSSMTLTDVYVGRVRRAPSLYDPMTRRTQPGIESAYGAFVSPGCTLSITNGYFDGVSTTESALASLGTLTLRGGVVTGSSRCAATRSATTEGTVTLDDVRVQGNGRDEVCVDDAIPALRLPMSPN